MRDFVLTSESMTTGHPDKLCDQISDTLVDACLSSDEDGGIVAECAVASGVVFISIRHRRALRFDPAGIARRVLADAGYTEDAQPDRTTVMIDAVQDPNLPSRRAAGTGASHMATVFGFACDHTIASMPFSIWAAHSISRCMDQLRTEEKPDWLSADAQVQVAVRYANRLPVEIVGVAATIAAGDVTTNQSTLVERFRREVLDPALSDASLHVSSATRISLRLTPAPGGPRSHAGLTGRKSADDAYGAYARHASSALSGKDPGRIERVAAYAARQAALSVVGAGLARECEVQLSYAPGDEAPLSVEIDTFGSGRMPDPEITARLRDAMDLRASALAERLDLWMLPRTHSGRFYRDCATYGHFGRGDLDAPWERALDPKLLA